MQVSILTRRLAGLSSDLVRRLRLLERQEVACCGVPLSQGMVLQALLRAGGSLRMSELAVMLGVAQSTATRLVEPLVGQELVERRQGREDGRVVVIHLTPTGQQRAGVIEAGSLRWSEEILDRIPEPKRDQVVDALEMVVRAVNQCCSVPESCEVFACGTSQTTAGKLSRSKP